MISKIIQKEKDRQNEILEGCNHRFSDWANCHCQELCPQCQKEGKFHKQTLINLKEYIEGLVLAGFNYYADKYDRIIHFSEDIKELTKMIERYDASLGADE